MDNRNYIITNGQEYLKFSFQVTKSFSLAGKWDQETANDILEEVKKSCKYMKYNFKVKGYVYIIYEIKGAKSNELRQKILNFFLNIFKFCLK
jgi:hypothetical protein